MQSIGGPRLCVGCCAVRIGISRSLRHGQQDHPVGRAPVLDCNRVRVRLLASRPFGGERRRNPVWIEALPASGFGRSCRRAVGLPSRKKVLIDAARDCTSNDLCSASRTSARWVVLCTVLTRRLLATAGSCDRARHRAPAAAANLNVPAEILSTSRSSGMCAVRRARERRSVPRGCAQVEVRGHRTVRSADGDRCRSPGTVKTVPVECRRLPRLRTRRPVVRTSGRSPVHPVRAQPDTSAKLACGPSTGE